DVQALSDISAADVADPERPSATITVATVEAELNGIWQHARDGVPRDRGLQQPAAELRDRHEARPDPQPFPGKKMSPIPRGHDVGVEVDHHRDVAVPRDRGDQIEG